MKHLHPTRALASTIRLAAAGVLALGAGQAALAASATAQGSADVVVPIAIEKGADLQFGEFSAVGAGTVSIATDGARSKTGGVVLLQGSTGQNASFNVTGHAGATYAITLPASVEVAGGGGGTMTMDNFVSDPSGTGTLTAGAQTINVGATLTVAGAQTVGAYAANFSVGVEYN